MNTGKARTYNPMLISSSGPEIRYEGDLFLSPRSFKQGKNPVNIGWGQRFYFHKNQRMRVQFPLTNGSVVCMGNIRFRTLASERPVFCLMRQGSVNLSRADYIRLVTDVSRYEFLGMGAGLERVLNSLCQYFNHIITDCDFILKNVQDTIHIDEFRLKPGIPKDWDEGIDMFDVYKLSKTLRTNTLVLLETDYHTAQVLADVIGKWSTMAAVLINIDTEDRLK